MITKQQSYQKKKLLAEEALKRDEEEDEEKMPFAGHKTISRIRIATAAIVLSSLHYLKTETTELLLHKANDCNECNSNDGNSFHFFILLLFSGNQWLLLHKDQNGNDGDRYDSNSFHSSSLLIQSVNNTHNRVTKAKQRPLSSR